MSEGVLSARRDAMAAGLREQFAAAAVTAEEAGWDDARRAWNLLADQHPAAVVAARSQDDVAAAARFAAAHGLRVAAQATGHGALALGPLDDTLLVRTDTLDGVGVDAAARRVRVGPAATWKAVAAAAAPHGLAALAGSSGDVGVVGYSLGGGIGWLARRHGLAANAITAVELVTADGAELRVDAEHEPELFWALRGGGGGFGVVTAMEQQLFPVPALTAGALFFPLERAAEVLGAWREWTATAPDEVTSAGRMMRFPPMPQLPEFLQGQQFAIIEVAHLAEAAATDELVADLRALEPSIDTIAETTPPGLAELHMDPPEPVPGLSSHRLLVDGGPAMIDALDRATGPESGSTLLSVELRHLGGALGRTPDAHGALDRLVGDFALFAVTLADPSALEPVRAELGRVADATAPWDAGRAYANFVEQPEARRPVFDEPTHQRLAALKAAWDPHGRIVATHPAPSPATGASSDPGRSQR